MANVGNGNFEGASSQLIIVGDFDEPRHANSVDAMQASAVSSVSVDGRRVDMEEISQTIQLLSEDTLSEISKGPLVKFTQECDSVE
jgi:hypothetical protein